MGEINLITTFLYILNFCYSFDTRVLGPAGHWSDDKNFGDRARWVGQPTSALRVRDVQSHDRAIYRCRVDFQVSPTRNYRIALDVIGQYIFYS